MLAEKESYWAFYYSISDLKVVDVYAILQEKSNSNLLNIFLPYILKVRWFQFR